MSIFHKKSPVNTPRRRQADLTRAVQSPLEVQSALFKRNRTLTGSMSSHVSSASEASGTLKSSRVQAHELVNQRRRIGGLLLIVLAVSVVFAILLTQLTAKVTVSLVNNPQNTKTTSYQSLIQEYLAERPFERLRFALDLGGVTEYLRQKAPEVDTVTGVSADGFAASNVALRLRTAVASWKIGDKRYYVDASGVSFTKNDGPDPAVEIVDQSGVQPQTGSAVASSRFLGYVGRTVALAAEHGLVVQQVVIPLGTTREIELHIQDYGYPIRLSIDREVGEQVEDVARAINYFSKRGQTPVYIDVRVEGKAYYR